ncbi:MAG: DUF512 domain-containing protein [Gemmatimonadota bacterium]
MVRIANIEAGSIAEELHLEIGTRIIRINGEKVRDGIDLTFLLADPELVLETVDPLGEATVYEIERDPGQAMGIVPAPDAIRECANECVFCFIDGNPPGVRDSLWLRDDDFRLSFAYGSYVTLTNLGPKGLARLVEQRISPLYVSVHTTDPELRVRLLKNQRAGLILDNLKYLLSHGLEVHTQVVLCPEWNDGPHLDRTLEELWALGPGILSLSVVPVGLTRYNANRPVRPLTGEEAAEAVEQVERMRAQALAQRGFGWCYGADELYLLAGLPVPEISYYDDGSLLENGVGSVRQFVDALDDGVASLSPIPSARIRVVTGRSMAPFFREAIPALEAQLQTSMEVVEVTNEFYGEMVTVAGLLGGEDILRSLGEGRHGEVILLPAEALNADDLFIDSLPLSDFRGRMAPSEVVTGYELIDTLRSLA